MAQCGDASVQCHRGVTGWYPRDSPGAAQRKWVSGYLQAYSEVPSCLAPGHAGHLWAAVRMSSVSALGADGCVSSVLKLALTAVQSVRRRWLGSTCSPCLTEEEQAQRSECKTSHCICLVMVSHAQQSSCTL